MSNSIIDNERDKQYTSNNDLEFIRSLFKIDRLKDPRVEQARLENQELKQYIKRQYNLNLTWNQLQAWKARQNKPWYIKLKNFLFS